MLPSTEAIDGCKPRSSALTNILMGNIPWEKGAGGIPGARIVCK
jgi:hypothetical protein